jgi:hypothetical protein
MSLKSVLTKIWNQIQNLFTGVPKEIKTAIHIGVLVTEHIKSFIDSPIADILTAIIPGDLDDKIKLLLRAKLPEILSELKLVENCTDLTNPDEITKCALQTLKGINENVKSAFLHNLSVLIAQVAADGKLTWSDGVYLSEWYYQYKFKTPNS